MFSELLSTIPGKIIAIVTSLVGVTGGMAATGGLSSAPGFALLVGDSSTPSSSPAAALGIPLEFPIELTQSQPLNPGAVEELALVAPPPAAPPAAAPAAVPTASEAGNTADLAAEAARQAVECLSQVGGQVSTIAGALPSITSSAQAESLMAQARPLIDAAHGCAGAAAAFGVDGSPRAGATVQQIESLIAQIQALDLTGPASNPAQGGQEPTGGAEQGTGSGGFQDLIALFGQQMFDYFGDRAFEDRVDAADGANQSENSSSSDEQQDQPGWETDQQFWSWFDRTPGAEEDETEPGPRFSGRSRFGR